MLCNANGRVLFFLLLHKPKYLVHLNHLSLLHIAILSLALEKFSYSEAATKIRVFFGNIMHASETKTIHPTRTWPPQLT